MKVLGKSGRGATMTSGEVCGVLLNGEYKGPMSCRRRTESKGNYQKFKTGRSMTQKTNVSLKIQLG